MIPQSIITKLTTMDTKKSQKADLDNKRSLFIEIGLVVALGIVLAVFEHSTKDTKLSYVNLGTSEVDFVDQFIPITRQDEPQTPQAPKVKFADIINIIDTDDELIDENIEFSSEITDAIIDYSNFNITPEEPDSIDDQIFFRSEKEPEFPDGGLDGLQRYIASHIKYPPSAVENGLFGRVFVQFVIDKTGQVTDVKLARSLYPDLDKEAIRVVKSMPKWKPGENRGRPVKVSYTIPINFVLN